MNVVAGSAVVPQSSKKVDLSEFMEVRKFVCSKVETSLSAREFKNLCYDAVLSAREGVFSSYVSYGAEERVAANLEAACRGFAVNEADEDTLEEVDSIVFNAVKDFMLSEKEFVVELPVVEQMRKQARERFSSFFCNMIDGLSPVVVVLNNKVVCYRFFEEHEEL